MQQFISGLEGIHDMKPFRPLFGKSDEERKKLQHFELYVSASAASSGAHPSGIEEEGFVRQSAVHRWHQWYG